MEPAGDLLAGAEIVQRHGGQRVALDFDDTLGAVHVGPLVHGKGEVAVAEQGGRARPGLGGQQRVELIGVRAGVAADLAAFRAIRQEHGHRAVALGLQAERAAELEGGGEGGDQGEGLAEQLGDGGWVLVSGEQRVGKAAEAHQAAAHGAARHVEGHDAAGHDDIGHVRAGAVEESWRVLVGAGCHRRKIGAGPAGVNLSRSRRGG